MKKLVALAMSLTMAFSLVACGNSDASNTSTDAAATTAASTEAAQTAPAEKQDVSLRIWGAEEDQTMLQGMIDSFKEHYADAANFDIQLGTESESTAKDTVLADIEAAADVYSFASDQLIDLVNAGALQSIDEMDAALESYAGKSVADVKSANASGSVEAATKDGTLYAFPMSADNGYFLYYNSALVTPEDAQTWDTLLAAAEKAGKKVGMTLASGWYNASFFYGAGFTTALNDDGSTAMDWNGTSADGVTGVQVVQAMLNITGNSAFLPIADGDVSNQIASGELCAVVSGTWDAAAAQTAFGDGYAATKLPTYTCGDKQIQQGSALKGIASMHCSANTDMNGENTAIFFGLSGTGKTTLSTDPKRLLIGDDEHGWDDNGVFNFEGGCYAKVIDLDKDSEPDIYNAIRRDALLENETVDANGKIDFSDKSVTENTRVSYPIDHIKNIVRPISSAPAAKNVIFLSADGCLKQQFLLLSSQQVLPA